MSAPVPEIPLELPRARGTRSAFLLGLGILALVGFVGYSAFVVFATTGPAVAGGVYLVVAVIAGAGAFFSPCSFPILPSYFAYAQVVRQGGRRAGRLPALLSGSAAAAGVLTFNVLFGLAFGVAGLGIAQSFRLFAPNPSSITVGLRIGVGIAWVLLGTVQIANVSIHGGALDRLARVLQPAARAREPFLQLYLYGFAYTLIGIGCTAPFLGSVIVISLASGGLMPALAGFLAFALTMAALMILVSIVASGPTRASLKRLSAKTPSIKRAGGAALIAFGVLLSVLSLWPTLLGPLFP